MCFNSGPAFTLSYVVIYFMFDDVREEVGVRVADIGEIALCLKFIFIT